MARGRTRRRWSDLSRRQQRGIIGLGMVQLTLLGLAQWDISRRSPDRVRGPKWMWRLIALLNTVGPVAYFFLGRR